ncbi:hypothetical protein [Croceicoccus gelatinilyticus]|uniref:hypothetical protein n=1 Tax=Croceicoccus gelatinilyticus TaxID=2835536 RepID=UPI001BCD06EE|nr:hypothetical protein [Croceicoccus gelatinilyticus]MBS7671754.1 hypothetical protein [Croceicoccus gelatinilyticus]
MILRTTLAASALFVLAGCNQQSSEELPELYEGEGSVPMEEAEAPAEPVPALSDADMVRVCKAAQAFSVGRDVNTVNGEKTGENMVRLSYTRDDGKSFRYDCRIDDGEVRTRMIDEAGPGSGPGQWSGRGSKTTFEMRENGIYVKELYFDGSSDEGLVEI